MPSASQQQPTVYVVDGDDDVRRSLVSLLGALGYAARGFSLFRSFAENYERESHGCLILDVRLSEGSGVALYEQFVRDGNRLPVIFISAHADVTTAVAAMKTGAVDFLEKPFDRESLSERVSSALELDAQWQRQRAQFLELDLRIRTLSRVDRETLEMLRAGLSNKAMAARKGLSERAIELRRQRLMQRLGVVSLAELLDVVITHQMFAELFVHSRSLRVSK
jgi:FixJ family two-component response regulator